MHDVALFVFYFIVYTIVYSHRRFLTWYILLALLSLGVATCVGVGLILYYVRRKVGPSVMDRMVAPVSIVEMTEYVALSQSDRDGNA